MFFHKYIMVAILQVKFFENQLKLLKKPICRNEKVADTVVLEQKPG